MRKGRAAPGEIWSAALGLHAPPAAPQCAGRGTRGAASIKRRNSSHKECNCPCGLESWEAAGLGTMFVEQSRIHHCQILILTRYEARSRWLAGICICSDVINRNHTGDRITRISDRVFLSQPPLDRRQMLSNSPFTIWYLFHYFNI